VSGEENVNGVSRYATTKEEYLEILSALIDEANEGRLCFLAFALQQPGTDRQMVEHFGPADITELACRRICERVAKVAPPTVATAIRKAMSGGSGVH